MDTYLSLFDGICDQTRELKLSSIKTFNGLMPNEDNWVISSSGRHMFVRFSVGIHYSKPGFTANIHFGIMINNFSLLQIYRTILKG